MINNTGNLKSDTETDLKLMGEDVTEEATMDESKSEKTIKILLEPSTRFADKNEDLTSKTEIKEETPKSLQTLDGQTEREKITKYLTKIKMWEFKNEQMNDPKKGWMPYKEPKVEKKVSSTIMLDSNDDIESDWVDIIEEDEKELENMADSKFINFGVIYAIIDFIFD